MATSSAWAHSVQHLVETVDAQTQACLSVYRKDRKRVTEDANTELAATEGAYGRRQLHELIQNGADAMLCTRGRIEVRLTSTHLYVANEGAPVTAEGLKGLMAARLGTKRGEEIGRFGLGFKSVLAISDRPQVFSRSVSFGFDRSWARSEIERIVPGEQHYPVLRLARSLNPLAEMKQDAQLRELGAWATTVVRLPLDKPGSANNARLSADLSNFPREFLLFAPHVSELALRDKTKDLSRSVTLADEDDGILSLAEGGEERRWLVRSTTHRPSKSALKDAGELSGRESVKVYWAAPMSGRSQLGTFWAFFPTAFQTTLSGIVNAPWKLSDDRAGLLEGDFNRELLVDVLPNLVAQSLHALLTPDDPGAVLDYLPARGRENRNWADEALNAPVFREVARHPALPDLAGVLRRPANLHIHPRDVGATSAARWAEVVPVESRESWVHPTAVLSPERRLKAERLVGEREPTGLDSWLSVVAQPASVAASAAAVTLAAMLVRENPELEGQVRGARIIRLENGSLAKPLPGQLFVRSSEGETGFSFIDPELTASTGVLEALKALRISVLDRSGELRNALSATGAKDWEKIWRLTRQVATETAASIFHSTLIAPIELQVLARTYAGEWRDLGRCLLAGEVIPADGSRDRAFVIDPAYHREDMALLARLGAVSQPTVRQEPPAEDWLDAYRDAVTQSYVKNARTGGSAPRVEAVRAHGPLPPWPLALLSSLSDDGRRAMTEAALRLDDGEPWIVEHRTNPQYGRKKFSPGPVAWWVIRHGRLMTNIGPWPTRQCLRADVQAPSADVLPIAHVTSGLSDELGLLSSPDELTEGSWSELISRASSWGDERRRYTAYAWASHFARPPAAVRVRVGGKESNQAPSEVAVSNEENDYRTLLEQQIPTILVPDAEDLESLISRWGMLDGKQFLKQEFVPQLVGEAVPLVDLFPTMKLYLDVNQYGVELQHCESIDLVSATPSGQRTRSLDQYYRDSIVYVTAAEPSGQLGQVSSALDLGMTAGEIRSVLDQRQAAAASKLKAELRACSDFDDRLALAVGHDELRRSVPAIAVAAAEEELGRGLSERELAKMAYAVHGLDVVAHFRSVLEERGLEPPVQWAGRSHARRFVTDLGFSAEYAGFPGVSRPAIENVDGPASLQPLHDYQLVVTQRVKSLLRGEGPARGMVSLPTGSGKTRVAVQAVVEEVADGRTAGTVIWIAQSDELCEQAVQTWSYVWRALGPQARLVISRFWGSNEVGEEPDHFQLVVATDDKLANAVGKPDYEWLTDALLVIVDEAHTSISASYTRVLDWLKRGRGRSAHGRQPLIGLSATPFRNTNEAETQRLASRYDSNRLDMGAFAGDPYEELQARRVLARVRQSIIDGADISLTAQDASEFLKFNRLPRAVETRLGEDADRNRRIVERVLALPEDWTILLFATTVENARSLAAQLTLKGVPAVSVSSNTEPSARRRYVEDFQAGRIRVLTNYNVLAQGFDAPAVRSVFVTRPTFSANLYQQMIGRGLRGPLNGGSEEVLIVNVRDNLNQFGDQLAFRHFDHLWGQGE